MSPWMQIAVVVSYGSLMWGLAWRFNRSKWANMRVADLLMSVRPRLRNDGPQRVTGTKGTK